MGQPGGWPYEVGKMRPTFLTPPFPAVKYMNTYSYIHMTTMEVRTKSTSPALDDETATQVAQLFSALSDRSRVRIIWALSNGESNVSDLAQSVGMTESAVSHQLRQLRLLRLVRTRKDGREVFYTLDDDHVLDLFQRGLDHVRHG